MKKIVVFLLFLPIMFFVVSDVHALTKDTLTDSNQSVLLEFSGLNAGLWSINYERTILHLGKYATFCARSGIGHVPGYEASSNKWINGIWTVPIIISAFIGNKRHHLILGCSYTASFSSNQIDSSNSPPTIYKRFESAFIIRAGYRYASKRGIIIEAYPVWLLTKNEANYFFTGFGASFGLALPIRIWN